MNIDKDIERCKELIKTEHSNWIGMSNQKSIENILSDRETWKKVAEILAEIFATNENDLCKYLNIIDKCKAYAGENKKTCKQCIIEWARNEVLKNE